MKRFLLCVTSACLLSVTPTVVVPARAQAQFRGNEQTSISVYQKAVPAVVTIAAGNGSGSGSIVSPEGLILTNEHVIRGARQGQVTVKTSTGKQYRGQVIAVDRTNDLALIRLNTRDRFPTIPLASADGIRVGQQVFAIGSPYGLSGTLTTGILSRIDGDGDLQTDAALNPGNSGGPLLNSRGELIGVNKAILRTRGGNTGIGFATSALIAQNFIQQNRSRSTPSNSSVVQRPTPSGARLGVTLDAQTFVIQTVLPGSPAAGIGLRPGDRLVAINGNRLREIGQLQAFLSRQPNAAVLTVQRNRRLANVRVDF